MVKFQEETGHFYNLEATPAEGTSYRLAKLDKARYPEIITAGKEEPLYTNSSQLPVEYTDDIFECCDLQDELQSLYTGGTVQHLYLGERIEDIEVCKELIKSVFAKYKMPYISITPTFSICQEHGYIAGEHFTCPRVRQGRRGVEPRGGLSAAGAELQSRQEGRIYAAQKVRYLIFLTAEPRGILACAAAIVRLLLHAVVVSCGGYFVRLLLCILCGGYCVRLLLCVVRSGFV